MEYANGGEEGKKEGLEWGVTHYGKQGRGKFLLFDVEGGSDGKLYYKLGNEDELNCLNDYFTFYVPLILGTGESRKRVHKKSSSGLQTLVNYSEE